MITAQQYKASKTINNAIAQESRTFLRWINSKLEPSRKPPVTDIKTDLSDGMILLELFEALSGRKIGNKFTKNNSKLRQHHLDRISLILECMHTENIETFTKIGETH